MGASLVSDKKVNVSDNEVEISMAQPSHNVQYSRVNIVEADLVDDDGDGGYLEHDDEERASSVAEKLLPN